MKKIVLASSLAALFFSACTAHHPIHWGYTGEHDPAHWGSVSEVCAKGQSQSPVNIISADATALSNAHKLSFHEDKAPELSHEVDNGHAIKITPEGNGGITVNGVDYKLVQYHFHGKSEHTIDGKRYDMVMHMVHQNQEGKLAVVAVMMKEGEHNKALEKVINHLDGSDILETPSDLLPKDPTHFYFYVGSLTTPPCSEGVYWYILKEPITLDADQLKRFRAKYSTNYRPLQPMNGRYVEAQ